MYHLHLCLSDRGTEWGSSVLEILAMKVPQSIREWGASQTDTVELEETPTQRMRGLSDRGDRSQRIKATVMLTESSDVLQLWRSCHAGNTERVEELIEDGVDYFRTDRNGETVLHMAARANNLEVVELLLDNMPDPDPLNDNHQTPLHLAASRGHIQVVKTLLRVCCDFDIQTKYSGMTALHLACKSDETEIVALLLDEGANCNIPDSAGKLPDFYTNSKQILKLFADHIPKCTHGRLKDGTSHPCSHLLRTKTNLAASSPDNKQSDEHSMENSTSGLSEEQATGNEKTSKNAKDEQASQHRSKKNWKKGVQKVKKLKINHSLGFSEEHKTRMQMNVFDRLMGGKK